MSTTSPHCPYCSSHDARPLDVAVTARYRCQDCGKIFTAMTDADRFYDALEQKERELAAAEVQAERDLADAEANESLDFACRERGIDPGQLREDVLTAKTRLEELGIARRDTAELLRTALLRRLE